MIVTKTCPCDGDTLDKLVHPAILAILGKGPAHGYRLAEEIGSTPLFGGRKPDVSGVYRALRSMEDTDLVTASWDHSQSGPARKSYRLTEAGRQCLLRWTETLQQYRRGITALLKTAQTALAWTSGSMDERGLAK